MEIILRLCFSATFISCGKRAIEPSSLRISIRIPAGSNPAKRAKSTAASVWPVRRSTPPSLALRGNICPGRPKSSGLVSGFTSALIVLARSNTEIPVVQPSPLRSIETVNWVWCSTVLFSTIISKPNSLQRFSNKGAQSKPRPCWVIKLIISGVTFSAAAIKSPSFSRFSSSTTMTIFPCLISSIASSMVLSFISWFINLLFIYYEILELP